ncbi:MAG: phosphoadenylyl-sulfate reductase [Balneolaceae bacterium]|nr:MAG: phosphoadenylyl-sulfate reductase [Balneolaceae bacterium]
MKADSTAKLTSGKEISSSLKLEELNNYFRDKTVDDLLIWGYETFGNEIVAGTAFGSSGIVILHRLHELGLPVKAFCLDTQLLFNETYHLWKTVVKQFDIEIEPVQPILTLSGQTARYGDELWKNDADKCCYIRKVLPLRKYLANKKAWITGLRRSQSSTRSCIEKIEWDTENKTYKINPLADWGSEKIWEYIHAYKLPYNRLHDEGYPSIGCIHCTSPVKDFSDERSGRWVNLEKTECGIHFRNDQSST